MKYKTFVFALIFVASLSGAYAYATTPEELQQQINEKAKSLSELNQKIQETQKNFKEASTKGKSLSQEIKQIDYTTSRLQLNIQASEIKIDKLKLEVESLGNSIQTKQGEIETHQRAIAQSLRQLQEKSQESPLITFFKNKSLSEGIFDTEALSEVSSQLGDEVRSLTLAKNDLADSLQETQAKKSEKEAETIRLHSKKDILDDQKGERKTLLAQTKNQEQIYQKQLSDLQKTQAEISKEIETIETELRKNIDPNRLPVARQGLLVWPVAGGILSQGYGRTAFAIKTYGSQWHNGVDIAAPVGTEITAPKGGIVINVGNQDLLCPKGAYGKFIEIKHDNGLTTLYGHLSKYIVTIGQRVEEGQVVAYVGKTGWATGPHVHFTVFASQTLTPARDGAPEGTRPTRTCGPMPVGGDIDPLQYLQIPS